MRDSLILIILFSIGIVLGMNLSGHLFEPDTLLLCVLSLTLFTVGYEVGCNRHYMKMIREMNIQVVLVPLSIIIGTLASAVVIAPLFRELSILDVVILASGFGYYSIAGVLVGSKLGLYMGSLALLTNVFRELITVVLTPLLSRYLGRLSPIAAGGATSMDVTLPIITKYSGKEYTLTAVVSGLTLTLLVPFLLSMLLHLRV
ncbi:lysine exporter LysO family protein [Patescibacteria group bacterium]|nr:lysine exporter LysO family protein [Patescibacteria group bacterium]MBU1867988.1 lysine exporter LysO family protein [Patescibacteria group bacterium]